MKIDIKTKNVDNQAMVEEYIERKIHFALDRIDERVDRVVVRLEDETKDSNKFDGLCRVELELHPRGNLHVSATGESTYDCILQAIRKIEHAAKHEISRQRHSAKIRHQQQKRSFRESLAEGAENND